MSFWAYILHCRGGYFYVGHTDDIDRRIADHKSGLIPGFTADHQPVELVWSDQFASREDAKVAERKLKGWSRAKKLALIRGDWDRISALAKKKDSASTSSARTGKGADLSPQSVRPELVEGSSFSLEPHPECSPSAVEAIEVRLFRPTPVQLAAIFSMQGKLDRVVLPEPRGSERVDGLWTSTCLEIFIAARDGDGYAEFNFSPSGQWASYAFDGYRDGMRLLHMPVPPHVRNEGQTKRETIYEARLTFAEPPSGKVALSAVIEETDGTKSYWALAHPPGKPDFHHATCFAATLPPPEGA